MGASAGLRRAAAAAALIVLLPPAAHAFIAATTRIRPPHVVLPEPGATRSWTRIRGGLREVYLQGSPEAIGASESRLLRDRMIADEARLWSDYELFVPFWIARAGIQDLSRIRYRHVDRGIPEARRRELAAQSLAFEPDPFTPRMPTYHRMVFLHALYDIALSFEHSPLIGCSTFAIGPAMTRDGHVIVARTFDMETDDALDRDKAVFLVREDGSIPFASVAWPGFVGVVTGMNVEGVFIVVHGGRAGEPRAEGMPVAFSLRQVLERAHDTEEAVAILRAQEVMVSHIVFVADGSGQFAIVERAPGVPAYVHEAAGSATVTNAFEGPLAGDPKNLKVLSTTTSVARAERIQELLARLAPHTGSAQTALDILRDHGCAGDDRCALGDRRAIDALIATHGVVADATARVLWVSTGPHLAGKFARVDLRALFAPDHDWSTDPESEAMPEDPILRDGRYEKATKHQTRAEVR
ncbi:MAG TPA: C45 family peptidase [Polyangiaceae bacterium]|nr:C45 family peptidase [Polyangiaceae bacterium]